MIPVGDFVQEEAKEGEIACTTIKDGSFWDTCESPTGLLGLKLLATLSIQCMFYPRSIGDGP